MAEDHVAAEPEAAAAPVRSPSGAPASAAMSAPAAALALQRSVGNRAVAALAADAAKARGGYRGSIPFAYAASALSSQAIAQLTQGDWQKAYDYSALEGHVPWVEWNAEQQAHWIQDHERLPPNWWWEGPLVPSVVPHRRAILSLTSMGRRVRLAAWLSQSLS